MRARRSYCRWLSTLGGFKTPGVTKWSNTQLLLASVHDTNSNQFYKKMFDLKTEATGQMAYLCDRKLQDFAPQINVIATDILNWEFSAKGRAQGIGHKTRRSDYIWFCTCRQKSCRNTGHTHTHTQKIEESKLHYSSFFFLLGNNMWIHRASINLFYSATQNTTYGSFL